MTRRLVATSLRLVDSLEDWGLVEPSSVRLPEDEVEESRVS